MTIFEQIGKYVKRVWGGFKKNNPKAAAVLELFAQTFEDRVDDMLIAAAKAGCAAATNVDGSWTDKLAAAVQTASKELGAQAKYYAKTDIINAVQTVYTAENK